MKGSYEDGKLHGEVYGEVELCGSKYTSLKVTVRGKYVDGKKQGYWQNDNDYYEYGYGGDADSGHYGRRWFKTRTLDSAAL